MIGKICSRCSSNSHRESLLSYPRPTAPIRSIRLPVSIFAGIAFAYLTLPAPQAAAQSIEYRTLPELINDGSDALLRGDFPHAAQAFNSILQNYREEPVWLEGQLPAKILPLAGFASHKSAQHPQAIDALETYLESYATDPASELFSRYTLAASLLLDGREDQARAAFAALRLTAGATPFRDLALLREAQLSPPEKAIALLDELLLDPHSPRLATHARLRLIALHLQQEDLESARIQLIDTTWQQAAMPELATLSLIATQVADSLLQENPGNALKAYQLVQPKAALIASQSDRIKSLQETYRQLAPNLRTEQSMWSEQFQQSIAALENQLQNLIDAPDYQDAINLRKARCFARINRPFEAWILLEPIAIGSSDFAREAHLDWISTARAMQAWNASALIAQKFIAKYPDDKHAPQVLFWIALAQIEQEDYSQAAASLQSILLTPATSTPLAAAARYYSGYCHFMLNNPSTAIAAFSGCITTAPELPVAHQAQLWIGICQFTTNQLTAAIATFRLIQEDTAARFLHPEAAFREIAALYASGDLEISQTKISQWLATYSIHPRQAEAQLLYGDILNELGQSKEAMQAYARVETDDAELAYFALEKLSTLLIEAGENEKARHHLEAYRSKQAVPPAYIGPFIQLLASCLDPAASQRAIADAIDHYGNQPQARGVVELIHLLTTEPTVDPKHRTLASRILVAQIQTQRLNGQDTQAKIVALQLAANFEQADLPPAALVEAGRALAAIKSLDAPAYFQTLLDQYPNSNYRDSGHLELARYHAALDNPQTARAHLLQLSYESSDSLALRLAVESTLQLDTDATETAERLLSERQASPQQKAQALNSLGQIVLRNGDTNKAYHYHQRVFTLYRGATEEVAQAYHACIEILASENRYTDAEQVARELLAQTDLTSQPSYQQTLLQYGPTQSRDTPVPTH